MEGKIVWHLLFDLFTELMATPTTVTGHCFGEKLLHGVEGMWEVLAFALMKLDWTVMVQWKTRSLSNLY
jgi:hypothetical protein